jgi:hypothetical protein
MMASGKRMRGASHNVVQRPPSTSSWPKYKEGRADVKGREIQTIQNPKPDSLISLSQARTSVARSSSGKRSRTTHSNIQKDGSVAAKIIIWHPTFRLGHQYLGRGGLHR